MRDEPVTLREGLSILAIIGLFFVEFFLILWFVMAVGQV